MKVMNVILAESDKFVRKQLEKAIEQTPECRLTVSTDTSDIDSVKQKILDDEPDVLVLGINHEESEEMNLFKELRSSHSHIPILILSPHDREGARAAISALKKGAVEYFPKTTSFSQTVRPFEYFLSRVIPVIKVTPRLNKTILLSPNYLEQSIKSKQPIPASLFETSLGRMELIVIAGCLGGIASLYMLLSRLPKNLPVPVIILQHIEEIFSEVLAEDLCRYTELHLKEAKDGDVLQKGTAYLAPGNYHLQVNKSGDSSRIILSQQQEVAGFRPSIDVLLDSVAKQFGANTLTVFLSGGGGDGIEGGKVIDIIGGQVIVQNKQTSLLSDFNWNMEVHGIYEGSYPIDRLAHEISSRIY